MRKSTLLAIMLFVGLTAFSQAVKDRNVVPVAVNLNQVLRMTITNGGNIEFVFNTIDQYKAGIGADGDPMYITDFSVASSTRWELTYGAEEATFIGTDDPTNLLALNNVGLTITNNGVHLFNATTVLPGALDPEVLISVPTDNALEVTALQAYPVTLIEDANATVAANAGDAADNSFTLNWRCGTTEANAVIAGNSMNAVALIDQATSPAPDRYVVNVLFELAAQ